MKQAGLLRMMGAASRAEPDELKAALACFLLQLRAAGQLLHFAAAARHDGNGLRRCTTAGPLYRDIRTDTAAGAVFAWCAARVKLWHSAGVFWVLIINLLIFYGLFRVMPGSRWAAAAFYCWFSVINLFLISVFWTLMADTFSSGQATRLFAFIAAGGSTGAILGTNRDHVFCQIHRGKRVGNSGLRGFFHCHSPDLSFDAEKEKLRALDRDTQKTTP